MGRLQLGRGDFGAAFAAPPFCLLAHGAMVGHCVKGRLDLKNR
jgi:hypothetical protein